MMKFYTYYQNNSGGSFHRDDLAGIGQYVIIEAQSSADANEIAESIGLYFDGEGDCSCCGNRWHEADEHDGYDTPCIYGTPITEYKSSWNVPSFIHFHDGTLTELKLNRE